MQTFRLELVFRIEFSRVVVQQGALPYCQAPELIHSDMAGPFGEGEHGLRYYVTFNDDYTKFFKVYFLPDRGQIATCWPKYVAFMISYPSSSFSIKNHCTVWIGKTTSHVLPQQRRCYKVLPERPLAQASIRQSVRISIALGDTIT